MKILRALTGLLAIVLTASQVAAQSPSAQTNAPLSAQTCGPVSGTLASLGASLSLNCLGASNYLITMATPAGNTALVGTFSSSDTVTGGARRLWKTGVGALAVSSDSLAGNQGSLEYRTVGGGYGQTVKLTAYTSGATLVTIVAVQQPTTVFVNGSVQNSDEDAVRAGRGFTASTGTQSVVAGQYLNLYIANPPGNTSRVIYTLRNVSCDNPSGQIAPKWYGLPNPTTGLPTTAVAVLNRKTGGAASAVTAFVSNGTTLPDTTTTTPMASRTGGMIPTGGMAGGPGSVVRTLEPGQSTVLTILGTASGVAANPYCTIDYFWYEEATN